MSSSIINNGKLKELDIIIIRTQPQSRCISGSIPTSIRHPGWARSNVLSRIRNKANSR